MDGRAGQGDSAVGLCAECGHARRQRSARGQAFWRCARAADDPRYLRYPPLPVRSCPGFEAVGESPAEADD